MPLAYPPATTEPLRVTTRYPGSSSSADEATSGMQRMVPAGTPLPTCQTRRANTVLIPPPLAPIVSSLNPGSSVVHPVSEVTAPVAGSRTRLVPPAAVTLGSDVGRSTERLKSLSKAPLSPEAAKSETPQLVMVAKYCVSMVRVSGGNPPHHPRSSWKADGGWATRLSATRSRPANRPRRHRRRQGCRN